MAFDQTTRNRLARFVKDARDLITDEFTQKFAERFGIADDGTCAPLEKLTHLDEPGLATAALLRQRIDYLLNSHPEERAGRAAAVKRLAREQAFTVLNRLAALRMAEKRGLILESVGKGYQSKGYKLYATVAGTGLGETYERYRRYLFCLYDELAVDLGALFDRHSPHGIIFPREPALLALLDLLNAADLEHLWAEDETIGWIYQYYNDEAERKKMREQSSAPRNSRELAVRNQFFTPRYVVEFLTDNTLGRIWYEMTQGKTALRERCRYLVRRPNEIFLEAGEATPEAASTDGFSQEGLLKQPVYIPHRSLKDPRELRMLDPACGSMHFGLYAFDLYEVIYAEAWDSGCVALKRDFTDRAALLHEVPRLIVEHNIHGVDIDPRAAQIAALSLWLRAQKSWLQQGIAAATRPRITHSHIVCAEPMPGDKALLADFVANAFPAAERPVFQHLLERIFDHMQLAGDAGSLLKIEEEIRTAIEEAKALWEKSSTVSRELFSAEVINATLRSGTQQELGGLETAVSHLGAKADFWESAEERIYQALRGYSEQAETTGSVQRRLFANDAAQGFAFIDLCRKRYEVALMNPPFGSPAESFEGKESYPNSGRDIYAMFVERMGSMRISGGRIGAILPRTGLFIGTMTDLRVQCYLASTPLELLVDLGMNVLDGATIRTACYVMGSTQREVTCVRIGNIEERETRLADILRAVGTSQSHEDLFIRRYSFFHKLPGSAIAYWIPEGLASRLPSLAKLEASADIRQGIATGDNFRFLRLLHELPSIHPEFCFYSKGGEPVPFISDETLYVRAARGCAEMKANAAQEYGSASRTIKNEETFGLPGITYSQVNDACLKFRVHPPGAIYDMKGPVLFSRQGIELKALLAFLNSSAVEDFMRMMTDGRQWHVTALKNVPVPPFNQTALSQLAGLCERGACLRLAQYNSEETGHFFTLGRKSETLSPECVTVDQITEGIDAVVWANYGATTDEISSFSRQRILFLERTFSTEPETAPALTIDAHVLVGAVFGRWDIRYMTGARPAPKLPDPFAPLPVCPPGMLQGDDGLPLSPEAGRKLRTEGKYPLDVTWGGILVDDLDHPLDLVSRVQAALTVICKDRAEAIEHEVCELLGVASLRDWFRRPAGFFADHLKRYSKSRRQAPIYWPLSTKSGSYTLWIYYHRLSDQTLHTAIADFVEPKIKAVEAALASARANNRTHEVAEARDFLDELQEFKAELERLTKLPWRPNLNDGVLITASPLWKLFRLPKWQKDLKACWEELERGDYDWAHLAYAVRPKEVEEKCKTDRSLSIAHGLEHLCQIEPPKPKAKRGKKTTAAQLEAELSDES